MLKKEEDIPERLEFGYNCDYFNVTWTAGEPVLKVGKNILPDVLTVECLKVFADDLPIDLYALVYDSPRIAGRMWVWANKAPSQNLMGIKKPTVLFVNVKTQTTENQKVSEGSIMKIIDENGEYFRQALIEVDDVYVDLPMFDDPNFHPGGHYYAPKGIVVHYLPYAKFNPNNPKVPLITYPGMPDGFVDLADYLLAKLEEKVETNLGAKKVSDCVVVFFLDRRPFRKTINVETREERFGSFAGGRVAGSLNVLISPINLINIVVTHEIGHALSLEHPFANKIKLKNEDVNQKGAKYTFEIAKTHNIMDYSYNSRASSNVIHTYHFWKWQWEYMNKKIMGDGRTKV